MKDKTCKKTILVPIWHKYFYYKPVFKSTIRNYLSILATILHNRN